MRLLRFNRLSLILRRPRSGRLEGWAAIPICDSRYQCRRSEVPALDAASSQQELEIESGTTRLKMIHFPSWPGFVPAIHVLLAWTQKTWMPGIADKFTQSAQGRLLWPGMTSFP